MSLFDTIKKIRGKMGIVENNGHIIINEKLVVGSKERIHISIGQIEIPKKTEQKNEQNEFVKPSGLWYAFGNEWIAFAKTGFEDGYFEKRKHGYKIYVDLSKIIVLKTKGDVDSFISKYGEYITNDSRNIYINWKKVARNYSGIEIPTYTSEGMHSWKWKSNRYLWLDSWDISSGCIWSPDAIIRIKSL